MKRSLGLGAGLLMLAAAQGCGGDDDDDSGLQCGPGTVQQGNTCVPQGGGGKGGAGGSAGGAGSAGASAGASGQAGAGAGGKGGSAGGGGAAGAQAGASGGGQGGSAGSSGSAGAGAGGAGAGGAGAGGAGAGGAGASGAGAGGAGSGGEGGQAGGKVGDACTPPFDLDFSKKVDPKEVTTPGRCEGATAIVCDAATQKLVANPCAVSEECRVVSFVEYFEGDVMRTTPWAVCVPAGAKACTYAYSKAEQSWTSDLASSCDGNAAVNCSWPDLPPSLAPGAGTTDGYVKKQACGSDEACAVDQSPMHADCFVAPLVTCDSPDFKPSCQGDTLVGCYGSTYAKKILCSAQGQVCGASCVLEGDKLISAGAECLAPMPSDATPCDPTKDAATCDGADSLRRCDVARFVGGACGWYATTRSCAEVQCVEDGQYTKNCKCAAGTGQGPSGQSEAGCVSKSAELCDPAKTPDACNGDVVRRCRSGQILTTDCAASGESCMVSKGKAGCAAKPAQTCEPLTFNAKCTDETLEACCPDSGEYGTGPILACAPGYALRQPCDVLGQGLPVSVDCSQEAPPSCRFKAQGP